MPSACVACGDCAQFCPMTASSEFDVGIATRKGIFIPFPQAVPNAYMINPEFCNWIRAAAKVRRLRQEMLEGRGAS